MKNRSFYRVASLLLPFLVVMTSTVKAQRKLSEATLTYRLELAGDDVAVPQADLFREARSRSYIKGVNSRTDLVTQAGTQSTLYLGKTREAILLKEYGNQRYLTRLTAEQWERSQQKYRGARLELLTDSLELYGYRCYKALAHCSDSTTLTLWYTRELVPVNKTFMPLAPSVPGLILQYEAPLGKMMVRYRIEQLVFTPVPQALFDIPESGYRILEYSVEN